MSNDFSSITDVSIMRDYLKEKSRFNRVDYFSQYTRISTFKSIKKNRFWILGNPSSMNDLYEYDKYSSITDLDAIFYTCFMTQQLENIAMWCMYATPLSDGIRISLPKDMLFEWIKGINTVYRADPKTKEVFTSESLSSEQFDVLFHRVVYEDTGKLFNSLNIANSNFNPYLEPAFAGYVKDKAWDYEKEARLRVALKEKCDFKAIAVEVPQNIIDSIVITKGPQNTHSILDLELNINKTQINESKFTGLINLR